MLNSTLTGNAAPASRGGGVYVSAGAFSIGNSLVAGNSGLNGKDVYNGRTFILLGDDLPSAENGASELVNPSIASNLILAGPIGTAIGPLRQQRRPNSYPFAGRGWAAS